MYSHSSFAPCQKPIFFHISGETANVYRVPLLEHALIRAVFAFYRDHTQALRINYTRKSDPRVNFGLILCRFRQPGKVAYFVAPQKAPKMSNGMKLYIICQLLLICALLPFYITRRQTPMVHSRGRGKIQVICKPLICHLDNTHVGEHVGFFITLDHNA